MQGAIVRSLTKHQLFPCCSLDCFSLFDFDLLDKGLASLLRARDKCALAWHKDTAQQGYFQGRHDGLSVF